MSNNMDQYARKNTEWGKEKKTQDQEDYTKYVTVYNF